MMKKFLILLCLFFYTSISQADTKELDKLQVNALFEAVLSSHDAYQELFLNSSEPESEFLLPYLSSVSLVLSYRYGNAKSVHLKDEQICNLDKSLALVKQDFEKNKANYSEEEFASIVAAFETNFMMINNLGLGCKEVFDSAGEASDKIENWKKLRASQQSTKRN